MNDKELVDLCLALGVGIPNGEPADYLEIVGWESMYVRDWRVAGALIEKVLDVAKDRKAAWRKIDPQGAWISLTKPISIPREIIEVCCESLFEDLDSAGRAT